MSCKPVIIGSSLTGLLISHRLSQKGIDHVLIGGDRPTVMPRLGESMNEGASLACWKLLDKKYQQFFYRKSHISLLGSKLTSMILVASPNRCFNRLADRLSDRRRLASLRTVLNGLCHLDRAAFDPVFYDDVTSDGHCEFIKVPAADIEFDFELDRVSQVTVGDRELADPTYVFDATGYRGVVAKAANVSTATLSGTQHVAWTHLLAEEAPDDRRHWWLNGTNLVRLDNATDGFNGIGWIIPMGRRVSIGISVDANSKKDGDAETPEIKTELIDAYCRAIERRGIPICEMFPKIDQIFEIKHQYYHRDRAFGTNWLLAGGTFIQLWFPTSSGVGTSTLAASLAPKLIEDPLKFGMLYQEKLEYALEFHNLIDSMVHGPQLSRTHYAFEFWAAWVSGSLRRSHSDLQIANREYDGKSFLRYNWIKNLAMAYRRNLWLQILTVGSLSTFVESTKVNHFHDRESPTEPASDTSRDPFRFYFRPFSLMAINAITTIPRYLISRFSWLAQRSVHQREEVQTPVESAKCPLRTRRWFDFSRSALLPSKKFSLGTGPNEKVVARPSHEHPDAQHKKQAA